ncbi:MAG: FkbM family methyltransferase, partial [Bacteroidota bacterium]
QIGSTGKVYSFEFIPGKLYFSTKGCYSSIIREHYKLPISQNKFIGAENGDVVLDLGGCFGDTALYFAEQIGSTGKVYSFEFIPGNIDIFNRNLELNPDLKSNISIVKNPLWDKSDLDVYYEDRGGGSKVSFEKFQGWEGATKTTTIDDFVVEQNIKKVDFIKTDIEGAEPFALNGAKETIKRFKPKLAISIYHSMDDFVNIIHQIDKLNLGYKFYLGHASIFTAETVLFCTV